MCHISYVICHSHISYIIFHVSSVIYHLSCVIKYHLRHHAWYYHISHLTYHIISWFNKFHAYKHPINTTKTPLKTKMILENPPNFNRNYIDSNDGFSIQSTNRCLRVTKVTTFRHRYTVVAWNLPLVVVVWNQVDS